MAALGRYALGLIMLVMGLNKFFGFFSMPAMDAPAMDFILALVETGYMFQMIAVFEILIGLMLLSEALTPLALVMLAPISINILMFHLVLAPASIALAAVVVALNVGLAFYYFGYYRPIFAKLFIERVLITDKQATTTARPVAVVN